MDDVAETMNVSDYGFSMVGQTPTGPRINEIQRNGGDGIRIHANVGPGMVLRRGYLLGINHPFAPRGLGFAMNQGGVRQGRRDVQPADVLPGPVKPDRGGTK